jgi:hypothetical protein
MPLFSRSRLNALSKLLLDNFVVSGALIGPTQVKRESIGLEIPIFDMMHIYGFCEFCSLRNFLNIKKFHFIKPCLLNLTDELPELGCTNYDEKRELKPRVHHG